MLTCERCHHVWKQRKKQTPSICPRCKSKLWMHEKKGNTEKNGRLYVVLTKEYIKIGQSINPKSRISDYPNIVEYFISVPIVGLNEFEKDILLTANNICGNPIIGREYFKHSSENYEKIVIDIKSRELLDREHTESENISNYDFLKFACHSAIQNQLPNIIFNKKTILIERINFLESINEAIHDYNKGICSASTALNSILLVAINIKELAEKDLNKADLKSIISDFDIDVNDICKQ